MKRLTLLACLVFSIACCWRLGLAAGAQPLFPQAPGEGNYVVDQANVLGVSDLLRINAAAAGFKQTTGVPIIVVTIKSLAGQQADPAGGIEAYALSLFNSWGVGSQRDNRGVLLLMAKEDRKTRIQLGGAWPASQDAVTRVIMDETIVPSFKRGAFADGLFNGVNKLGAMIESSPTPGSPAPSGMQTIPVSVTPPTAPMTWVCLLVGLLPVVFIVFAFARGVARSVVRGRSPRTTRADAPPIQASNYTQGWMAWGVWDVLAGGSDPSHWSHGGSGHGGSYGGYSGGSGGGGGDSSGGSFGGGSSSGGGSTGSW